MESVLFSIEKHKIHLFVNITNTNNFMNDFLKNELNEYKSLCPKNIVTNGAKDLVLAYISDLHLDYRLDKLRLSLDNERSIREYFQQIIKLMCRPIPLESNLDRKIIFVGDICHQFEIFKIFFEEYRTIIFDDTFVVLGNHELWGSFSDKAYDSVDNMIEYYRNFLKALSPAIILLENELWFPNSSNHILHKSDILALKQDHIDRLFNENEYAIFGGIGFAGNNKKFNQTDGIYGFSPITYEEEIHFSKVTSHIHKLLKNLASTKKIIFATHMPLDDWSNDTCSKNWIYLHGHTHINYCIETYEKNIYANNQIGYSTSPFSFKLIYDRRIIDLDFYSDGVHEITCREYIAISWKLKIGVSFNREYEKMYMIKRQGLYMFFAILPGRNSIKILCGGQIRNARHDLQYYYDNICDYADKITSFLEPYTKMQNNIAEYIKKLGGSGNIHGAIIDIDYNNHIFVNPLDGAIVPYYAISMANKYVYKNITALLEASRSKLKNNLLINEKLNALPTLYSYSLSETDNDSVFVEDTKMYAVSLKIKDLQCITNKKVIRCWSDDLLKELAFPKKKKAPTYIAKNNNAASKITVAGEYHAQSHTEIEPEKSSIKSDRLKKYEAELLKFNSHISVLEYSVSTRAIQYYCSICNFSWKDKPKPFNKISQISCPNCHKRKSKNK